ncbi:hypothetical protein DYB34_001842 [Aphanomyces astaci]|nr:hypothetical protein DYB34_001842 [Aphanomyces astaci]
MGLFKGCRSPRKVALQVHADDPHAPPATSGSTVLRDAADTSVTKKLVNDMDLFGEDSDASDDDAAIERYDRDDVSEDDEVYKSRNVDALLSKLPQLGIKLSDAKAIRIFDTCDKDGSGEIDMEEFKMAMFMVDPTTGNSLGFSPSSLLTPKDAFHLFDSNGSGQLDELEFADALEYFGFSVTDAKQERLFLKYDTDKSGFIEHELVSRGVDVPKYATRKTLMQILEKALDEEERREDEAMDEAKWFHEWQLEKIRRRTLAAKAALRAQDELAAALDAAGQKRKEKLAEAKSAAAAAAAPAVPTVEQNKLPMMRRRPENVTYDENRVSPPKLIRAAWHAKQTTDDRGGSTSRTEDDENKDDDAEESELELLNQKFLDDRAFIRSLRFKDIHPMTNTGWLWGRGQNKWWKGIEADDDDDAATVVDESEATRKEVERMRMLTSRSELIKMAAPRFVAEAVAVEVEAQTKKLEDKRVRELAEDAQYEKGPPLHPPRGSSVLAVWKIAAGESYVCAVSQNGSLYSWGVGISGRLGHGKSLEGIINADADHPSRVMALQVIPSVFVKDVACAFDHSAAVSVDGHVYSWGSASTGKLGVGLLDDSFEQFAMYPMLVPFPNRKRFR